MQGQRSQATARSRSHIRALSAAAIATACLLVVASKPAFAAPPTPPTQPACSVSLGTCHDGELVGGEQLPARARGLMRLSVVGKRFTGWGTQRLVGFVLRTASRLADRDEHARIPLRVGNLSTQRGGRIRWSHSHRAGRDVDLAFFAIGKSGKPRAPDRFLRFNDEGKARYRRWHYTFDVARNWNLVKTLLTDHEVHVARLYVAEPLRRMLLQKGRELGDPEWLLQRAAHVLHEPLHAGRHNDHFHVRVYCSRDEVLAGCVDDDPPWPWVADHNAARRQRIEELVGDVASPDVQQRSASLAGLAPLHAKDREATEAIAWLAAHDPSAKLRGAALGVLRSGGSSWTFPALTRAARRTHSTWRAFGLLKAAIDTAGREDVAAMLGLTDRDRNDFRELLSVSHFSVLRRKIARRIRPWLLENATQPMMQVLDDPSPTTRRAALRTLEYLANRRFEGPREARTWYARAAHFGRLHWMYEGFFRAGVAVEAPPRVLGPQLIDMLRGPDEVLATNAEALLSRVTGGVTLTYVRTPPRRHRAWRRWWQLHNDRFNWQRHPRRAPPRRLLSDGKPPPST